MIYIRKNEKRTSVDDGIRSGKWGVVSTTISLSLFPFTRTSDSIRSRECLRLRLGSFSFYFLQWSFFPAFICLSVLESVSSAEKLKAKIHHWPTGKQTTNCNDDPGEHSVRPLERNFTQAHGMRTDAARKKESDGGNRDEIFASCLMLFRCFPGLRVRASLFHMCAYTHTHMMHNIKSIAGYCRSR